MPDPDPAPDAAQSRKSSKDKPSGAGTGTIAAAQKAAGNMQARRSAPAVVVADGVQKGHQSAHSGMENVRQERWQRSMSAATSAGRSAWGQQPSSTSMGHSQAGASGSRTHNPQSDEDGPSMVHARSDAGQKQGSTPYPSAIPFPRSRTEPDLGTSKSSGSATPSLNVPAAEVESPHVKAVHEKMRDMMDRPFLERKRTLKDLLVEHHPDKNPDEHATVVFQAVNNARTWFLHEPKDESQNEAQDEPTT